MTRYRSRWTGTVATGDGYRNDGLMELPGHDVTSFELEAIGFLPLTLEIRCLEVPYGPGCEWTTIGHVPEAPGIYGFTVETGDQIRVTYVGKTEHLWMV